MAKAKTTRKASKSLKALTIPQLRKSFDHIDQWVNSHITKPTKQLVPAFQAEWKKVFGRVVEAAAAAAYLDLKRSKGKTRRVGRPLGQKGGAAALAGAPLDYTTHQGSYGVYGQFPAYQTAGLAPPADSFSASCGNGELKTVIPPGMGSNEVQKGGRLGRPKGSTRKKQRGGDLFSGAAASAMSSLTTIANRPFFASSPPTAAYTAQMATKGVDTAVPLPAQTVYTPQAYNPAVLSLAPAAIQANLPVQLRTGSI
jgi:hypothetical protein